MIHDSIIVLKDRYSIASESFRMLRTNLSYINIDNDNKVIMFTSASPEEGKTTSVCNTAVTLALTDKKTLLIECDLRRPLVHQLFGFNQEPGLTDCLFKNLPHDQVVNQVQELTNLYVLTAGVSPPDPAEVLSSTSFQKFVEKMREIYDFILIDAPPVLAVADATVISQVTDGVIFVMAANKTKINDVKKARSILEKVGSHILGGLLTKADGSNMKNYHSYYSNNKPIE